MVHTIVGVALIAFMFIVLHFAFLDMSEPLEEVSPFVEDQEDMRNVRLFTKFVLLVTGIGNGYIALKSILMGFGVHI